MKITLFLFIFLLISNVHAQCYKDSIVSPSPFLGNNDEIFKLASGSIWQVKFEYEYLYEYYPSVIICPDKGKLIIQGKQLNIEKISENSQSGSTTSIIQSQIEGDFNGWEGETIYKLTNGQVWQQASYKYMYSYSYMPKVIVYRKGGSYFMQVGDKEPVRVIRLR